MKISRELKTENFTWTLKHSLSLAWGLLERDCVDHNSVSTFIRAFMTCLHTYKNHDLHGFNREKCCYTHRNTKPLPFSSFSKTEKPLFFYTLILWSQRKWFRGCFENPRAFTVSPLHQIIKEVLGVSRVLVHVDEVCLWRILTLEDSRGSMVIVVGRQTSRFRGCSRF